MSADNFVRVKEVEKGQFRVEHVDASSGGIHDYLGTFNSLKEAMDTAYTFEKELEFGCEYGIQFTPYYDK